MTDYTYEIVRLLSIILYMGLLIRPLTDLYLTNNI